MKKTYGLILAFIAIVFPLKSQQLSRSQCRELALEYNKKIIISRLEQERAGYEKAVYKSNFFPKIALNGGFMMTDSRFSLTIPGGYLPTFVPSADGGLLPDLMIGSNGLPVTGPDGNPIFNRYAYMPDTKLNMDLNKAYMGSVSARQPLYTGGKIRSANRMATLGEQIATSNIRKTKDEIIASADDGYWQLVKVLELYQVAVTYEKALDEIVRNIENSLEFGMTISANLLRAKTKMNEAKLMVRKAQNGINLARMNLCHITGLPLDSAIEPINDTDNTILHPVFQGENISGRAEVEMLQTQVSVMQEKIKIAQSEYMPQVLLMGGYNYMGGGNIGGKAFDNNGGLNAAVTVTIPLVTWGENRNKVRSAKTDLKIAQMKKNEAEELMLLEATKAFNDLEEAFLRVELTASSIDVAIENSRINKDNFELGMGTLSDYLEAEAMLQEARSDYVEAKAAYYLSETAYLKGIGKLEY